MLNSVRPALILCLSLKYFTIWVFITVEVSVPVIQVVSILPSDISAFCIPSVNEGWFRVNPVIEKNKSAVKLNIER